MLNSYRYSSDSLRGIIAACLMVALGLSLSGCDNGPPKGQVSGTVTLDGKPVENGTIQFYPIGNAGQTAGTGITDGKYDMETSTGEMTVTINATKVVGEKKMYDTPDSPVVDVLSEIIPAEYNSLSTLKVTIEPGTNENVDFKLTSK